MNFYELSFTKHVIHITSRDLCFYIHIKYPGNTLPERIYFETEKLCHIFPPRDIPERVQLETVHNYIILLK